MREVIFQSKMNFSHYTLSESKRFIFNYYPINTQFLISSVPASIVGELMKLWDEGVVYMDRIIAVDEMMETFTIVSQKSKSHILVLNMDTGIYYDGVKEAYEYSGLQMSSAYFWRMLSGRINNKTNFQIV